MRAMPSTRLSCYHSNIFILAIKRLMAQAMSSLGLTDTKALSNDSKLERVRLLSKYCVNLANILRVYNIILI